MSKIKIYWTVSVWLTLVPFCIYTLLYWYPTINYFSYIDNPFLAALWDMKWLHWFCFVSAPGSWILLLLMWRQLKNESQSKKVKLIFALQFAVAILFLCYWIVILRMMLMI